MPRGIGHCAKQAYACVIGGGRRWGLRAGVTAAGEWVFPVAGLRGAGWAGKGLVDLRCAVDEHRALVRFRAQNRVDV